jgi:hypothetical protein
MHGATSVRGVRGEDPEALQDAEHVAVHWEHVAPEAVTKPATSNLPRKSGQLREDSLGVSIVHPAQFIIPGNVVQKFTSL